MLCVEILAGAVVEVETLQDISLRSLNKADQIKFRTVKPLNVGDVVVIASKAPVTFTVSETEENRHRQSAGIVWGLGEVIAVDGTHVPLYFMDDMLIDTQFEEIDKQGTATCALIFPSPMPTLLCDLERRKSARIPSGKRYQACFPGDITVIVPRPS